jgi:hypothetical protein
MDIGDISTKLSIIGIIKNITPNNSKWTTLCHWYFTILFLKTPNILVIHLEDVFPACQKVCHQQCCVTISCSAIL